MTVYPAPAAFARATGFERVLLRTATRLDSFVSARLERRSVAVGSAIRVSRAETLTGARDSAVALAAIGILPR